MKNTKINIIIGFFISLIGVVLLLTSIKLMISNNKFKKQNIQIMATVTDCNKSNKFTAVSFYIDKKEYNAIANDCHSGVKPGDEIKIYYNKENPSEILLEDNDRGSGIYLSISLMLLVVGLCMIIHNLNNSVDKETVKKLGKIIQADLDDIVCNTRVSNNGKNTYIVICSWKNKSTGKIYKFKSENLWYDPSEQLKKSGIEKIPVHIMPSNPNQYYVDMDLINKQNCQGKNS